MPVDLPAIYQQCSADELAIIGQVHPITLALVVKVESSGVVVAVNVNKLPPAQQPKPTSAAEAAQIARYWIAAGYTVDLGLGQISNRNLARLGYTIEQMFVPCTNLVAASRILTANYAAAVRVFGEGQEALGRALRQYNTGSFYRGDAYLARYNGSVPALANVDRVSTVSTPPRPGTRSNPLTASMTVRWWGGEDDQ